ncbi:hypothetical protein Tco_1179765 [Tanacetum coccineum]
MLPGENINEYYVQFHKLVNDMRNIRMTMPNLQLNSKFVNNMSPEWDRGNGAAGNGGAHNRAGNANACQGKPIKCYNCMLDEEELLFLADKCDAFDSDVDDEPTAQSIFMANLSSAGPSNLQAGPSNASILSKSHDLKNAIDTSDNNQVEHEIHNEVQQKNVIDSTSANIGNSNVIPYEQYLTVNDVLVVPSCASYVSNDAYVLHDNDAYAPHDPLVTELAIYKEQVSIYEQCAKFKLTEWEQRMDDQMRILIQDHNQMEEKLKKELHSVKLYDQDAETAIGVQNPFYLRKAKLAQLALYDGDEILKMHHVLISVTSYKEDLELAEINRQKMNEKINDPVCVQKRVKIIPPNYSKENFLATFTPQTQLTPEQVFWSKDLLKKRAEDLKANAPPLPVLPPVIVFWEFEKTCKKQITPMGITEGERGFEQTKRCYLTEVIPFFNLLKEHFDGVQKSLVTEVRAMKAVFENMEAEVDQNAIDKKCG